MAENQQRVSTGFDRRCSSCLSQQMYFGRNILYDRRKLHLQQRRENCLVMFSARARAPHRPNGASRLLTQLFVLPNVCMPLRHLEVTSLPEEDKAILHTSGLSHTHHVPFKGASTLGFVGALDVSLGLPKCQCLFFDMHMCKFALRVSQSWILQWRMRLGVYQELCRMGLHSPGAIRRSVLYFGRNEDMLEAGPW